MPTLPIYESKQNIQANTAGPLRNEAAQPYQDDQKILQTVGNIAQKWSDAHDVMQYTEAKAKHDIGVVDILSRASADPFINSDPLSSSAGPEKYIQELNDLKKKSVSGINNQAVQNKLELEMSMDSQIAQIKVNGIYRQKAIEHNQVVLDAGLDALAKQKVAATTDAEAQQLDLSIRSLIDVNVRAGNISEKEGQKRLEQVDKSSLQYAINTDPEMAEKMLTSGQFPSLTSGDQANYLQVIDAAKKQREADVKKIYNDNKTAVENDLTDRFFKEKLTAYDLERAAELPESQGGASRTLLESMKDKLYTTQVNTIKDYLKADLPKAEAYNKAIQEVFDTKTDLIKARKILIDAYADGKLNSQEAAMLDKIKNMATSISQKKESNPFVQGYNRINNMLLMRGYISDKPVEEQANDMKEYIRSISSGEEPEKAADEIILKRQKANYPAFSDWVIGGHYDTIIGPVEFIGRDKDGMPIVRKLNAK